METANSTSQRAIVLKLQPRVRNRAACFVRDSLGHPAISEQRSDERSERPVPRERNKKKNLPPKETKSEANGGREER